MKIRSHRDSILTLESIALTDIILNIFIFFFTSFSLIYTFNPTRESRIMVKLPQADVKTPVDQKDPLVININSRNEIFLGNKRRSLKDLKRELQSLCSVQPSTSGLVQGVKMILPARCFQPCDSSLEDMSSGRAGEGVALKSPKRLKQGLERKGDEFDRGQLQYGGD